MPMSKKSNHFPLRASAALLFLSLGAVPLQAQAPVLVSPCATLEPGAAGIAACRELVRRDPTDVDALGRLAMLLDGAGQHRDALAAYEAIIRLQPDSADAYLGAGRALDALGRGKDALHRYEQFVARRPGEPRGHQIVGWALLEQRRFDDALRAFREATRLDPVSSAAFLGSGMALAELGRREEALRAFHEAARLQPREAEVWGQMAETALALGRRAEAVSYWERALKIDPAYFDARGGERRRWERSVAAVGPQAAASVDTVTVVRPEPAVPAAQPSRRLFLANTPTSSGSGFVVSDDGLVLTNKHVIRGCTTIRVREDGSEPVAASIRALDADDDLALLRPTRKVGNVVASFRADPAVRPGDDVVAVGYPLSGLLADQVNVSTGSVNALAGLYNDLHLLQMSAPVQPGSSGGPLFDRSGNVVGVVVTKLNAKIVAEETGDIPQNVNFAIKGAVARDFLKHSGIPFHTAESTTTMSNADVGDVGRKVTVLVECWK